MTKHVLSAIFLMLLPCAALAQDQSDGIPILELSPNGGLVHSGAFEYAKNFQGGIWDKSGPPTAIVVQNGRQAPVVSKKGLGFLNRQYGGQGAIELVAQAETPSENVIDLEEIIQAMPPIELFEDDGSAAITPMNGTWVSSLEIVSEEGCPPGVSAAAMASVGGSDRKTIAFSRPNWSPRDFGPGFAKMSWDKVGSNIYVAAPYATPPDTQRAHFTVIVQFLIQAVSDKKFNVRGRVIATFSGPFAKIGDVAQRCKVVAAGTYEKL